MTQITKFSIRGYRSFKKSQVLNFAQYSDDASSCGITYLVGENNSGKTSILEALRIGDTINVNNNTLNDNEVKNDFALQVYGSIENRSVALRKVTLANPNWYETRNIKDVLPINTFSIIPSRRYWQPRVDSYQSDLNSAHQNALSNMTLRHKMENSQYLQVATILHAISRDQGDTFNEAISLIRRVFPDFNTFKVVNNDGQLQIMYEASGIKHRSDMLGDGVVSVMAIVAFLIKKTDTVLVIDEPELSLHPLAQKRLAQILYERSHTQQIVISTHSPHFIDTRCFEEGAVLNRVVKINDRESTIYHTDTWATYRKLLGGRDYQKPRIFDSVAKEIFFEDNILFVEGQDDRSLLENSGVLNDCVNIFGYGVGGKDSFKLALTLARDIGIQRAAVLIDGGKDENAIVTQLKALAFDDYTVIQWNRHDIRDKAEVKARPKFSDGYFNQKGILKSDLDDFGSKIVDINDFFSK